MSSSDEDNQQAKNLRLFEIIRSKTTQEKKIQKIKLCLKNGANANAVNSKGKTILQIAQEKKYHEVISYLLTQTTTDTKICSTTVDNGKIQSDVEYGQESLNMETSSDDITNDAKNTEITKVDAITTKNHFLDQLEIPREGMSQHGNIFQLKLLMLVLWRAIESNCSMFRLATEFPEGEKFDDIVFQYQKNPTSNWKFRLFQAKHKESAETGATISGITGFFASDDDAFSIQKYFKSYFKIKQKCERLTDYSIFSNSEIEDVIIITNADFESENLRKYFCKGDLEADEILGIGKAKKDRVEKAAIYKVKDPSMDSELVKKCLPIFENTSDYYTLIENLTEGIVKEELNKKKESIIKEYFYPLVNNLLEIQHDGKKSSAILKWNSGIPFINDLVEAVTFVTLFDGKKIKISANLDPKKLIQNLKDPVSNSTTDCVQTVEELAEDVADNIKNDRELDSSLITKFKKLRLSFDQEFLDVKNETFLSIFVYGISKENKKLSDEMKRFRRTFIKCLLTEDQKQTLKRDLDGKELKIFEKLIKKFVPVNEPIISNVPEFAEQMRNLIFENRSTKVIKINKATPSSIRDNLQMLSGYLLTEKYGNIRFSSSFLYSDQLPKTIKEFKEQFAVLLKEDFNEIYQYKFKMEGFDFKTCEDGVLETTLPVLYKNEDVLEFFDKLKFVVNFPNRMEINDLLDKNIREKFKILDGKAFNSMYVEGMHDWMATRIGTFLTPDQANQMFKDIANNLSLWTVDGITKAFFAEVSNEFQFRRSHNFIEFLKSEKKILIIAAQNVKLTRIRIVQTFLNLQRHDSEQFKKFTRGFGHIFLNLKQIENADFRSYVWNQIENSTTINLIVIECNTGQENSELCRYLNLLDTKETIKIVLIVPYENFTVSLPNIQFKQEYIDMSDFEDLDDKSKLKCLSQKITFQGQQTTFNDILANDKIGDIICPDILCRMIEKKDVSIGCTPPLSKGYQEVYYVERYIHTKVYVDLKILKNKVIDYRVYEYELNKGSVEECDIVNDKNDIVIISDLAGMGKSTLLSSLTIKIKDRFPDRWLFRIDLNDCTTALSEELRTNKFNRNDLDWANLLKKMLSCSPYTKLDTEQENKLFFHSLSFTKKIILLLDGVDEISPNYTKIIIELILALRDFKLEKILITTRPNIAKELEKQLNVFAYSLETFSEVNQITFLTKFWKKNILKINENIDDRLNLYAKSLITKVSTWINDRERSFTGIPLQLMMMAEIFQNSNHEQDFEGCSQFVRSNETEPKLPKKLNLHDLYTMFIKEKYRIYSEEKKKNVRSNLGVEEDNEILIKTYQEDHRMLALYAFFEDDDLKILLDFSDESIVEKLESLIKEIEDGKERRGIIVQVINKKPKFIHRTFMEYFVAEFVVETIRNHKRNKKRAEFILTTILNNAAFTVIRSFMNNLFVKKRILKCEFYGHLMFSLPYFERYQIVNRLEIARLENNPEIVRFILGSLTIYDSSIANEIGREILCALPKNLEILKIFVENGFDIYTRGIDHLKLWFYTCEQQSLDTMQWLMLNQKDIDVNFKSSDGLYRAPLHLTILNENEHSLEILKLLLDHGADINARDSDGLQPLHMAACKGSINLAKYLIERGADVNCMAYQGNTLLHCVATVGQTEFCKWLLNDYKVDINQKNEYGDTALHLAMDDISKLLLEHGADVNACDKNGFQPLHVVASAGKIDLAKYLIERGADINCLSYNGWTLFHAAVRFGRIEFCKWLLKQHKADVNKKTKDGSTPLHIATAVKTNRNDIIKLLLEHGANINARDNKGFHSLHKTGHVGNINAAKYLIECGADINCINFEGYTLLHRAARYGRTEFCRWLLKHHKAEVNKKTKDGSTPLHLAVAIKSNRNDIIELLLQHGADIDARDERGFQPIHTAATAGSINIAEYLLKWGANINCKSYDNGTLLHCAARSGNIQFIEWLLNNHKLKVNKKTKDGKTPLHLAVNGFRAEVIKLLLEHGADIYARDSAGLQPLHTAAYEGSINLAKYLIERGANINCKSYDNWTLLHCAARSGKILFIEWLLNDQKVEVNPKNKYGETPLQLAVVEKKTEITKTLLEHGGKMYPLIVPYRGHFIEFILKSHPELFAPLTIKNFRDTFTSAKINWDGTVDLIDYLKTAAETLKNDHK